MLAQLRRRHVAIVFQSFRLLEQMTAMEPGAEFDRQYLAAQMQGHEQLRALHAAYAENGQNPMARGASIVGVPAIDSHMSMLRAISERMG